MDGFCAMEGLPPPLRESVVVVDATSIVAAEPERFRSANPELFALVLGLGDPAQAAQSGSVAPRERITILAGSAGRSLTPVFTGCAPSVNEQEIQERRAAGEDGSLERYFGRDIASAVHEAQDDFRRQLLVSLMQMAKMSQPPVASTGNFASSPFAQILKLVGRPPTDDAPLRRLFVFTDLAGSLPGGLAERKPAREAGFAAASQAQLNLGRADVYLIPARGTLDEPSQQFLKAFLLGSSGNLLAAGSFTPNGMLPAPKSIEAYRGELPAAPQIRMPLEIRLATGPSNELIGSWVTYTGSFGQRSTPLLGQYQCSTAGNCLLRSDPRGGLGQLWSPAGSNEPEPLPDGPFGGLRYLEARGAGGILRGRIYDPVIFLGEAGDLKFEVRRAWTRRTGR